MADLSSDANIRIWGPVVSRRYILDSSAAQTIYKGQPMIVDQSVDATGQVCGFVDATVVAATDVFVGIAAEGKVIPISTSETLEKAGIEVFVEPTVVGFKSTVYTDGADVGKTVYMSDSATLSATPDDNPMIGKLLFVEGGYAYVKLATAICAGA